MSGAVEWTALARDADYLVGRRLLVGPCGGLNETVPHKLICLNATPVEGIVSDD